MSLEHPDYFNRADRQLYDELFYRKDPNRVLTQQENDFCIAMYHMEEFACGLDG